MIGGTTESQKIFSRAHHSRCLAASLCCCDFRLGRAPHSSGSQSHTDRGIHSRRSLLELNVTELKQWQQLLCLPFYASSLTRLQLFSAAPHMLKSINCHLHITGHVSVCTQTHKCVSPSYFISEFNLCASFAIIKQKR